MPVTALHTRRALQLRRAARQPYYSGIFRGSSSRIARTAIAVEESLAACSSPGRCVAQMKGGPPCTHLPNETVIQQAPVWWNCKR